jgi:hypothetical protein
MALFDELKADGFKLDSKVYSSLMHILHAAGMHKEVTRQHRARQTSGHIEKRRAEQGTHNAS